MKTTTVHDTTRLGTALANAEECFWKSIAESFPEITTGDFEPSDVAAIRRSMRNAVRSWIALNAPAAYLDTLPKAPGTCPHEGCTNSRCNGECGQGDE